MKPTLEGGRGDFGAGEHSQQCSRALPPPSMAITAAIAASVWDSNARLLYAWSLIIGFEFAAVLCGVEMIFNERGFWRATMREVLVCSISILVFLFSFLVEQKSSGASEITQKSYLDALKSAELVDIPAPPQGDKKPLNGLLFVPQGPGPFPAMVALHGAGGIFPYQAWWARQIANTGVVVLFVDSYCTRGYLCVHDTGDEDRRRGAIMRKWDEVSIRQRMADAVAGYLFLTEKKFVNKKSIGLVGWSWGGSTALFSQRYSKRLRLPNGGFKGTIAFYPNLIHVQKTREWKRGGKIGQPTLILYGKADSIEDEDSYSTLIRQGHPGPLRVVGLDGAVRKFDELGPHRMKEHPRFGSFPKAFHEKAFEQSIKEVSEFVQKYL